MKLIYARFKGRVVDHTLPKLEIYNCELTKKSYKNYTYHYFTVNELGIKDKSVDRCINFYKYSSSTNYYYGIFDSVNQAKLVLKQFLYSGLDDVKFYLLNNK